jgi:hypothetical protein
MHEPPPPSSGSAFRTAVGLGALGSSALYLASGAMALVAHHLFATQLVVGYVAALGTPFAALGLSALQRPRGGWASTVGAVLYGAGFVGLAGMALYALVTGLDEAGLVLDDFATIYPLHAVLLVAGALVFGASVVRGRVLPAWTGLALIAGAALTALVALGLPPAADGLGAAVRCVAFAGMGVACLRRPSPGRGRRPTAAREAASGPGSAASP